MLPFVFPIVGAAIASGYDTLKGKKVDSGNINETFVNAADSAQARALQLRVAETANSSRTLLIVGAIIVGAALIARKG